MEGTQGPSSVAYTSATKFTALTNPLPVFGEDIELVIHTSEMSRSLLGNLSLSEESIAAAMALEYCARAVSLRCVQQRPHWPVK